MKLDNLDLTEQTALGAAIIVFGGVGSVVTIGATIWADRSMVVALAAGFASALSISLLVGNSGLRKRIRQLEADKDELKTELASAQGRADHWSNSASNVSQAVITVLNMSKTEVEKPPPRRPRAKPKDAAANQEAAKGKPE